MTDTCDGSVVAHVCACYFGVIFVVGVCIYTGGCTYIGICVAKSLVDYVHVRWLFTIYVVSTCGVVTIMAGTLCVDTVIYVIIYVVCVDLVSVRVAFLYAVICVFWYWCLY